MERIFTFDTTSQALWAEETAVAREFPAEVVAAPSASQAKCGLALRTFEDRIEELAEILRAEGIAFRLYP